jgi:uncharacterized protein (TIGR02391 family)
LSRSQRPLDVPALSRSISSVRWDDLQVLKAIDEHEASVGPVSDGLRLMDTCRGCQQVDHRNDPPAFAYELQIARDAGLIEFELVAFAPADPRTDAYQWLQQLRDIRLTIAGRDRARGRVVIAPLPDPGNDDGRMITGYTLQQIGRALAETYTTRQLPRVLLDGGIPSDFVRDLRDDENKWEYLSAILEDLLVGGSALRRALRTFIGAWLTGQLNVPPSDGERIRLTALLAQQGWHIRDGVLVIGERTGAPVPAAPASARRTSIAGLHPLIREAAERYAENHLEVAIFEAFTAVNNRVKELTSLPADGSDLMAKAFGDEKDQDPPIRLAADLSTESGRNVQTGFKFIFMGAVRGIRNPDAHQTVPARGRTRRIGASGTCQHAHASARQRDNSRTCVATVRSPPYWNDKGIAIRVAPGTARAAHRIGHGHVDHVLPSVGARFRYINAESASTIDLTLETTRASYRSWSLR